MSTDFDIDDLERFEEVFGDLDLTATNSRSQEFLFVYGTMLHGHRNNFRLNDCRYIGSVFTKYYCFDLKNRHTERGYKAPMMIQGEKRISGELYQIPNVKFVELDMYEGHPTVYRRIRISVIECQESYTRMAWTYAKPGVRDYASNTAQQVITRWSK